MPAELETGQIIAGRYVLESPIGEGAMGTVFRAEDQTLKRQIAIKFLFVKGTRDPQAMIDQFLREARIAASVQHRNVIQTVDFGTCDQYQPFMVMELLSGESLGERMAREPGLTREQLIHIVSLTLRGLAAVHDAGIVHRDLKPQNIFLQRDADAVYPKILDFGISRSLQHGGARPSAIATQEGLIVGTPDYMSPEQARGEANIDKRSDIYSMAVVLYEGLTGRLPFEADTVGDLIVQIMTQEPQRLREIDPSIPEALSDMVAQAMSKSREHRFADARAMRRALLAVAQSSLPGPSASLPPLELGSPRELIASAARSSDRAGAGAATWGDFEGLNAPRIVDNSLPPPARPESIAPAAKNQRRVVVRRAEEPALDAFSSEQPKESAPAGRTSQAERARKGSRKSAPAQGGGLELALDPLYAGADQQAPEIDYGRAKLSPRKPQQPSAPRPRASRPLAELPRQRVRYKRSFWPWLLPAVALILLGYVLWKPSLGSLSDAETQARSVFSSGVADSGLKQLRLQVKGRRQNPGQAPPHMRDVVF